MTNYLKTLIEEVREKVIKLFDDGYTRPTFGDLVQFETLITQAFHAGEAKGRNDAVDYVDSYMSGAGLKSVQCYEYTIEEILEAARQGEKESTS